MEAPLYLTAMRDADEYVERRLRGEPEPLTVGSLCTGIGGIDLGLERSGMRVRWQVEIDPYCQERLRQLWPHVLLYGDLRSVTGYEIEPVDVLCGGYPCQPFSQAGKRAGEDDPRHLWPEFARILRVLRERGCPPGYVLLENVAGHLSLGFGSVLRDLAGLGYDAEWTCVRASDRRRVVLPDGRILTLGGASHLRKRVFIIGYLADRNRIADERWGIRGSMGSAADAKFSEASQWQRAGHAPDNGGIALADRTSRGWRELREPSGEGRGFPDRDHEELADAERARWNGSTWDGIHSDGPALQTPRLSDHDGNGSGPAGADVSDSRRPGSPNAEPETGSGPGTGSQGRAVAQLCGAPFRFAPGPNDTRWRVILSERPDLAPALESPVRRVADGVSDRLDREIIRAMADRTKRLSRLGNAVVPDCAEWFGWLIRRHAGV